MRGALACRSFRNASGGFEWGMWGCVLGHRGEKQESVQQERDVCGKLLRRVHIHMVGSVHVTQVGCGLCMVAGTQAVSVGCHFG